jgi:hypothetical protein
MAASENEETIVKCGTTKGDITLKLIRVSVAHGFNAMLEAVLFMGHSACFVERKFFNFEVTSLRNCFSVSAF